MSKPVILTRGATFSACGEYRYDLARRLSRGVDSVAFVMLNPSTADAYEEDPTIRRCLGFARDWGYRDVRILNIFALRSTDPRGLREHIDPIGPLNDEYLRRYCAPKKAHRVIVAWGTHGAYLERGARALAILREVRGDAGGLEALTWTKEQHPGHPLYVKGDLVPQPVGPLDGAQFTLPSPEEFKRRLKEGAERYKEIAKQMEEQMKLPPPGDPFWTTPFGCELRGVEA